MQGDGNFVIYPGTSMQDRKGEAIWASGSNQQGANFKLQLHDDGNLTIHEGAKQRIIWCRERPFLGTNEILHAGEYLTSDSGRYRAHLFTHGDFAVYDTVADDWLWNAGVNSAEGDYFACMQGDGNFVIYRGTDWSNYGPDLWSTGVHTEGEYFIYMQDDGNLALYPGTTEKHGQCLWGIGNSVMIDFDPQKYAFKFPNDIGLGVCGGMCAAALHRWKKGTPLTDKVELAKTTPGFGTSLYNELVLRQAQTLDGVVLKQIADRTMAPDKGHNLNPFHSMKYHTHKDWTDHLKSRLDAGKPTILVLIVTEVGENMNLAKNHQVLAIGYRQYSTPEGYVRIRIYDPNDPDRLHWLRMVFSWEFIDAKDETSGKKLRGFFVNPTTDAASA
jgi:hypothetical protein